MDIECQAPSKEFQQSLMTRQINQEINLMESRNNLPVCNSRPLYIGLDISSVCNIKCIFCLAEDGRKKKSDPNAFRDPAWIDNLEPLLPFIKLGIFSSFEAILNPRFTDFVAKLHKHYTPFQIFTNGVALTPELSEICLRHGMESMHCSFHGAKKETYEQLMKGANYDKVVNNLMQLKYLANKFNPEFTLVMVFCAMQRNIAELLDYVDLAHQVGARVIQVNYLLVCHENSGFENESLFFNQDLYDYYVNRAKQKARQLGIILNHQPTFHDYKASDNLQPCYKPWEHLNVNNNGDVTICCGGANSLGNIFNHSCPAR